MALQGSGAISISQIRTELGSASNSLRTLSAAAGKSAPDSMSEFYGYTAYTPPSIVSNTAGSWTGTGTSSDPYIITQTSSAFSIDSGFIEYPFTDECCPFMEWLHWNYNYYTGATPGIRFRFRILEVANTRVDIKLLSASISGLGSAQDSFGFNLVGFGSRTFRGSNPQNQAINVNYQFTNNYYSLNTEFDLRIFASHISEQGYYDEFGNYSSTFYGGTYPTINSLSFSIGFSKV